MPIHPTAIVDPSARIDDTAVIGPFCVIGADVSIGAHTGMKAHVYVEGPTWIGEDNLFYPYSSVGVASPKRSFVSAGKRLRRVTRNDSIDANRVCEPTSRAIT